MSFEHGRYKKKIGPSNAPAGHRSGLSWNGGNGAFGADEDGAAAGIGADGVEPDPGFPQGADAGGVLGRAKIKEEFRGCDEETEIGLIFVQSRGCGGYGLLVVGDGGKIGLREDLGKCPGLAAILGKREVGAVAVRMFVIAAGDDAVQRIAKCDGKDTCRLGTMDDGSIEDLPRATAVRRVEDARGFASSREPEVGIIVGKDGEAGVAGGKSAFAVDSWWKLRGGDRSPALPVAGDE